MSSVKAQSLKPFPCQPDLMTSIEMILSKFPEQPCRAKN